MTMAERVLYHQIRPAKLAVGRSAGVAMWVDRVAERLGPGCMRTPLFVPILSLTLLTTSPVDSAQALQTPHTKAPQPDCSFRSAATCWTLSGRFPARRREGRDSVPADVIRPPPASLASEEQEEVSHAEGESE
jgi:hypothetical protein